MLRRVLNFSFLAPAVALCLLLASCALGPSSAAPAAPVPTVQPGASLSATAAAPASAPAAGAGLSSTSITDTSGLALAAGVPVTSTEGTAAPGGSAAALAQGGVIHLVTVPDGTSASYKAVEQLAGHNFLNDAVGTTQDVTGTLAIRPDGTLVPGDSRFVVNLTTLKSDVAMRDGYLQRNTLQTSTYPDMVFVPMSVAGLPNPLPASGDLAFTITGDCTLKGVTHHVTWHATAQVANQQLTGMATTTQTFESLGLTQPHVMRVLTIQDSLTLQIDFHMVLG